MTPAVKTIEKQLVNNTLKLKRMKKLKLSLQNIEGAEILTREQLKKVVGGLMASGTCQCENPGSWENPIVGLSLKEAKDCSSGSGGHWCCDSCCDASWADHTDC